MTIPEYNLRLKAFQLREIDETNKIHQLAWAINMASQRKKNGVPVYRRFDKFFDYKKALNSLLKKDKKKTETDEMKEFIAKFNSRKGG